MVVRGSVVLASVLVAACPSKDAPPPAEIDPGAAPEDPVEPAPPTEPEESDDLEEEDDPEEAETPAAPMRTEGPITFKLHNLCPKSVKYALAPLEGETEIEDPKTIKGGAVEEVTAPYGVGIHLIEEGKHSAAATNTDGGHVWIGSSCTGVGASDDPKADPAKLDRRLRDNIERMKKASQPPPKKKPEPAESEDSDDSDDSE